ncbi:UNVERIFIED_CONTAM: SAG-related sequence SRS53A [Hammondia hammondi]|eukprot:XP_008883412.1 SAG-related sequence SRS53A [Hammondia hammondi]
MASALFFIVALLMSSTVVASTGDAEAQVSKKTCTKSDASSGISVEVDKSTKKVSFACGAGVNKVQPSDDQSRVTQCYTKGGLTEPKDLASLFGDGSEATVTPSNGDASDGDKTVTLKLGKLPQTTQTIYFGCTGESPTTGEGQQTAAVAAKDKDQKCVVTVTVPADPDANTCTLERQTMNLEVTSGTKSVSFQCDTGIATLIPGVDSKTIFDETCAKEVPLADTLPSAKLATEDSRYTFTVDELPETAATFCYKCSAPAAHNSKAPEQQTDACNVKINISAASLESAATSATAGSFLALIAALLAPSSFLVSF